MQDSDASRPGPSTRKYQGERNIPATCFQHNTRFQSSPGSLCVCDAGSLRQTRSTSSLAFYTKRRALAMYSFHRRVFKFPCKPSVVICAWRKGTALHQPCRVYAVQNLLTSSLVSGYCLCIILCPSGRELSKRLLTIHGKKNRWSQKIGVRKPRFSHPVGCWCLCSLKEKGIPRESLDYPPWK